MEAKELIRRYSAGERDFAGSDLRGANLSWSNLSESDLSPEQLAQAKTLDGATMPDGTKHKWTAFWQVRELPGELAREMRADDDRGLVLRSNPSEAVNRGKIRVGVKLAHVKGLVAALAEAAVDPVALQTTGGEYHG